MQRHLLAGMRTACAATLLSLSMHGSAKAIPVPISARFNIQSILANKDHPGSTVVQDIFLLMSNELVYKFSSTPVAATAPGATTAPSAAPSGAPAGDANVGAKLVQANGCEGCHGAGLKGGGIGPALFGIERKLSADQIADFIRNPRPPMPNFGFKPDQVDDIVAYLSGLDGGATSSRPVVTFDPTAPTDMATVTVRFPGTPPKNVSVTPFIGMGSTTMPTSATQMTQSSSNPHVFTGRIVFSMGGPWTVRVQYDKQTMTVPLNVGQ